MWTGSTYVDSTVQRLRHFRVNEPRLLINEILYGNEPTPCVLVCSDFAVVHPDNVEATIGDNLVVRRVVPGKRHVVVWMVVRSEDTEAPIQVQKRVVSLIGPTATFR